VRFLHTADWHIGKTLRGISRIDEQSAVLDEIRDIAVRENVDCVLVPGDLFESRAPSPEAERLVFSFFADLICLKIAGVVIGGNHDHPKRLAAVRSLLDPLQIHFRPEPMPAAAGGVIELSVRNERACIAVLPFASERHIIDACALMGPEEQWYQEYAENVTRMMDLLAQSFHPRTINILLAHVYAFGAETSGSEWNIHTSQPYAIPPARFPASAQYIALGHLHRPQEVKAPVPCYYSGSPLQLDFGETGQAKRVLLIDAKAGRPVHVESIPLTTGRNLRRVEGRIEEIEARAEEYGDDYLRVVIVADGPVPGIADRVRASLPNALYIELKRDEIKVTPEIATDQSLRPDERFDGFYRREHSAEPPEALIAAFNELYEEEIHAAD